MLISVYFLFQIFVINQYNLTFTCNVWWSLFKPLPSENVLLWLKYKAYRKTKITSPFHSVINKSPIWCSAVTFHISSLLLRSSVCCCKNAWLCDKCVSIESKFYVNTMCGVARVIVCFLFWPVSACREIVYLTAPFVLLSCCFLPLGIYTHIQKLTTHPHKNHSRQKIRASENIWIICSEMF